jgi:hypothetical protein
MLSKQDKNLMATVNGLYASRCSIDNCCRVVKVRARLRMRSRLHVCQSNQLQQAPDLMIADIGTDVSWPEAHSNRRIEAN